MRTEGINPSFFYTGTHEKRKNNLGESIELEEYIQSYKDSV